MRGKIRAGRSALAILLPVLLWLALTPSASLAAEEILSFSSDIQVQADGSMAVTETIQVRAEGREIKRGIYRDFPTDYRDRLGNRIRVAFVVLGVRRDGKQENWFTERLSNGVRVYAGRKEHLLSPGVHTYAISYRTDKQLGFFEDHDELYWNVTGNGWVFPILKVEASVSLPDGIPADAIRTAGYTGPQGSREEAWEAEVSPEGRTVFRTTRPLGPEEGLTVVVGWPKGFVAEPTREKKVVQADKDNRGLIFGALGLLLVLVYYLAVWARVGRDPEKGTIIPLFEPPHSLSPAAMNYLMKMGYDRDAFAAAVIDLAVKGHITISKEDKHYTLALRDGADDARLSKGEKAVAAKLFGGRRTPLVLKSENHKKVSAAIKALKETLQGDLAKTYFLTNGGKLAPGILLSVAALAAAAVFGGGDLRTTLFATIWLGAWIPAVFFLWAARRKFMGTVFTLGLALALFGFSTQVSFLFTAMLVVLVAVNLLFAWLMKAPTLKGRKVMDQVEGFRMYLSAAERHRLDVLNPPEKTPELFERYLPYALALDVGQEWSEQFSDVLARAAREGQEYRPSWYRGDAWDARHPARFASSLGSSLGGAISSAATAPGSSSGFGRGGRSGGGGGGGGGGGW